MNTCITGEDLMKSYYSKKKDFCSNLNMEDITDIAKRVFKNVNDKKDDYHDL